MNKFEKRTQISNFVKIRSVGAGFFPCGRKDGKIHFHENHPVGTDFIPRGRKDGKINFHENPSSGDRFFPMWTEGRKDQFS